MKSRLFCLGLIVVVSLLLLPSVFCQEETAATAQEKTEGEDVSWVWGEVKAVDLTQGTLSLSYIDYQTEEEKLLTLNIDTDTKFENAKDLASLKVGDTASIDYVLKDGKNIAKNVSIEKIEETAESTAPEETVNETTPQETAPPQAAPQEVSSAEKKQ